MITFGTYVFPAGFRLATQGVDSKIDEVELLGLAGTHAPPAYADAHTISLEGSIGGGELGAAGDPLLSVELVKAELVTMIAALNVGYALLDLGDVPQRAINAQKKSLAIDRTEGYGQRLASVKLAFDAPDPRFLSGAVHALTADGSALNAGDAPSFPVVTFTGPCVNPAVSVSPFPPGSSATPGTVTVACGVTLAAAAGAVPADVLTINCDPRQRSQAVVLNGIARLDLLGTTGITNTIGNNALFPYLSGGLNGVGFGGISAGGAVLFQWRDAWSL